MTKKLEGMHAGNKVVAWAEVDGHVLIAVALKYSIKKKQHTSFPPLVTLVMGSPFYGNSKTLPATL